MKIRLAFIAIIFFAFGALMLSQIYVVNAQVSERKPVITAPITYFYISGRVMYKWLDAGWANRWFVSPAIGAKIRAFNVKNGREVSVANADSNGYYSLRVEQGVYRVKATDSIKTRFEPTEAFVDVSIGNVYNVDFSGYHRIF